MARGFFLDFENHIREMNERRDRAAMFRDETILNNPENGLGDESEEDSVSRW